MTSTSRIKCPFCGVIAELRTQWAGGAYGDCGGCKRRIVLGSLNLCARCNTWFDRHKELVRQGKFEGERVEYQVCPHCGKIWGDIDVPEYHKR